MGIESGRSPGVPDRNGETSAPGGCSDEKALSYSSCRSGARLGGGTAAVPWPLWLGCFAGPDRTGSSSAVDFVAVACARWPRPMGISDPDHTSTVGGMKSLSRGDIRLIIYEDSGEGPRNPLRCPGRPVRIPQGDLAARFLESAEGAGRCVPSCRHGPPHTGTSFAPVIAGDGWGSYAGDQLALMDHLGIETFAVVGMCIGGAFIMRLLEEALERVTAAVALQPIGLDGNRDAFLGLFDAWRREVAGQHPEARDADWKAFRSALFGADRLTWSVDDELLPTVTQPLLVLQGDDEFHPSSVSQKLAMQVPSASLVERWKDPVDAPAADAAIKEFLAAHAR
jgi:pimeloyl-ACP methyl ester carboxylesterase